MSLIQKRLVAAETQLNPAIFLSDSMVNELSLFGAANAFLNTYDTPKQVSIRYKNGIRGY